ncbi:MAG: phosphoribosylformylglycinamidine synthase subunit PurQ, partial [Pseudomonadota bacterium]
DKTLPAGDNAYYGNPNGSRDGIAGISNRAGNVAGLMPHPENAVLLHQAHHDGEKLLRSLVGACA